MNTEDFDKLLAELLESLDESLFINVSPDIMDLKEWYGRERILVLLLIERSLTPKEISNKTLLENRKRSMKKVLSSKGKEYGTTDRLHNFRKASQYCGKGMMEVAEMFALKHLMSIQDMIDGNLEVSLSMIDEKIGDAINYEVLKMAIDRDLRSKRIERVK